jgi:hypothetical protein
MEPASSAGVAAPRWISCCCDPNAAALSFQQPHRVYRAPLRQPTEPCASHRLSSSWNCGALTGGAERLIVDFVLEIQAGGHHVDVYTAHHDPKRCFEETAPGTPSGFGWEKFSATHARLLHACASYMHEDVVTVSVLVRGRALPQAGGALAGCTCTVTGCRGTCWGGSTPCWHPCAACGRR